MAGAVGSSLGELQDRIKPREKPRGVAVKFSVSLRTLIGAGEGVSAMPLPALSLAAGERILGNE